MSGGSHVYRPAVRQVRSGKLPGSLVLAVVEATQLPVTGNANCLQTESAGQPLLLALTGRAESPGPVPLWVEMVPPGDTPVSAGPGTKKETQNRFGSA
jgi:hypothetical protein